jgi:uncharacterized protein YidB (DUF937 family)
MSILSTLAGALGGAANPNNPAAGTPTGTGGLNTGGLLGGIGGGVVLSQIVSMIQSRPGGLGGILQSLQQGGLGHLVESWIGTGQNLPVSTDQVRNTLGPDWISRITQMTGLSQADVEQHLSQLLPQVVDHLSPNGQLPQGEALGSELASVAQRLVHR